MAFSLSHKGRAYVAAAGSISLVRVASYNILRCDGNMKLKRKC
jgi:hypothetical protein